MYEKKALLGPESGPSGGAAPARRASGTRGIGPPGHRANTGCGPIPTGSPVGVSFAATYGGVPSHFWPSSRASTALPRLVEDLSVPVRRAFFGGGGSRLAFRDHTGTASRYQRGAHVEPRRHPAAAPSPRACRGTSWPRSRPLRLPGAPRGMTGRARRWRDLVSGYAALIGPDRLARPTCGLGYRRWCRCS